MISEVGSMRIRALLFAAVAWFAGSILSVTSIADDVETIRVEWYSPNGRWDIPLVCFELMRRDPTLRVEGFTPLRMQGGMGYQSGKIMSFATGAGPDVFNMFTYEIASYIEQGFLLPLNEFIGTDGVYADGTPKLDEQGQPIRNGMIDDDEAIWPFWKQIDPLARKIVTHNGIVYAIPARRNDYLGLLYRRDLLREHGIEDSPPRDWDAFYSVLQELTRPEEEQRGIFLNRFHVYLYPWVWAAGGNFVMEGKTNPSTGRTHWFVKEELDFIDPETGASLRAESSEWKVTFTTPEVFAAYDFLWKLFHGPWIRDAASGEAVNLTRAEAAAGRKIRDNGAVYEFNPADVIFGVARTHGPDDDTSRNELFERGDAVFIQTGVGTDDQSANLEVRPDQVGFWALPPRRATDAPVVLFTSHWLGLSPSLAGGDLSEKRRRAWNIASNLGSEMGRRMYVRYMVEMGRAMFMRPEDLRVAGHEAYVEEIPEHWKRDYAEVFQHARYEPFNANWLQVARNELSDVFEFLARDPDFDYREALRVAENRANQYIMRDRPASEMRRYRRIAYAVLVPVILFLLWGGVRIGRSMLDKARTAVSGERAASVRGVYHRWLPWALMAPALLSILLWMYYPLLRGSIMAFMDYRLMGERSWVGMDNFINVFLDPVFHASVFATLRYVAVALGLTFVAPIILAIMLNEIPWFKQSFRVFFFLPQVSSSVVVLLLWKQMYDPSSRGLLNQVLLNATRWTPNASALLGRLFERIVPAFGQWLQNPEPIDWLGSTFWAPFCIVLPTLWAGLGMGSLIYLAALKSVPDDMYEAADIDGAAIRHKMWFITIPTLKPLIVINFVGAFIGTFRAMQQIFVMTGGGAGTRVLGLHIWLTAYADLKFGPATATAWMLGSMLIGFTVWQLRILKKVEFRRAAEN